MALIPNKILFTEGGGAPDFAHGLKFAHPCLGEWRRQWHPTPVLLPGETHGQRSLLGCSPWGHWGSDTTEQLHFHFSLSCIGEGNGNPLQCSCLENPRDGGAWWAAVYGVTQSQTRLKWHSSSSSSLGEKSLKFCFHLKLIDFLCFGFLCKFIECSCVCVYKILLY